MGRCKRAPAFFMAATVVTCLRKLRLALVNLVGFGAPSAVWVRNQVKALENRASNWETLMAQYQCDGCGFIYNETEGCEREGFPAGTPWSDIPEDWACPDCAVREKPDFNKCDD